MADSPTPPPTEPLSSRIERIEARLQQLFYASVQGQPPANAIAFSHELDSIKGDIRDALRTNQAALASARAEGERATAGHCPTCRCNPPPTLLEQIAQDAAEFNALPGREKAAARAAVAILRDHDLAAYRPKGDDDDLACC